MKKKFTFLMAAIMLLTMILPWKAVGQDKTDPTVLFHETFGDNSGSARVWDDSYSVKSGVSAVYSGITGYTITNAKQSKNNAGSTQSGLIQTTKGTDAYIIIGPLNVANYTSLGVTYQWKAASVKETYTTNLYYKTSSGGSYTEVTGGTGAGATSFVERSYATLPASCQTSTLYLKVVWNTSNTQALIDEVELTGVAPTTYTVTYNKGHEDATGTMTDSNSPYLAGVAVTLLDNTFTREGYLFDGWEVKDSSNDDVTVTNNQFTMPAKNVTVTAKWVVIPSDPYFTAANVNLAYNAESGSINYTVNNPVSGGVVTAEITGGNTDNWLSLGEVASTVPLTCSSANTMGQRSATVTLTYTYNTNQTVTKDVTVTQAPAEFTITFHGNGGKTAGNATEYTQVNVVYNTETALTANTFTRDGYLFNNWNTEADASGYSYNNQANVTLTESLHLYAQWTTIPTYTLVTDVDDIIPGAHYVIVGRTNNGTWAMGAQTGSNTYRNADEITGGVVNNQVSQENLMEFVISGPVTSGNKSLYTIYDESQATKHFLDANGGTGNNYINVTSTIDNTSQWTIAFGDGDEAVVTANFSGRNLLSFNSSANPKRFTCYASKQTAIYLFKKDIDNNIHPYSSSEYSSEVTIKDDITLSSDYTLTVANGGVLTLTGSVSCSNASWLVVEDGGQLIISSSGSKTDVKATFQRDITAYEQATGKDNYYLIANPTTDVDGIDPTTVVGMIAGNYDLYYFDEAQSGAEWRNYKKIPFNLFNGKGYLYANSSDRILNFPGTVPTGTTADITLSKSGSGTYNGFNLVGNPLSNNVTSMKIGESSCSYYKVNSSTGVFAVSTDPIIVGEAVMVEAPSDEATLILNPSAKDEDGFTNEVIRLEVSNSKFTDVAYVYFGNHLPLTKINHLNDEAPMLYIHNENSDKAVEVYNNRGEVKSVDVNFEAKTTGTYNISAKMMKGEVKYMHLYDRLTGIDTDLLMDDYSFIGAKGDIAGRFILNLESVDNNSSTGSDTFAYQSGNDIIVNGEGTLTVYDVTGRKVLATTINGVETINGLNSGVYIFRIIGETLRTQKIVVR